MIAVNLKAAFYTAKALSRHMIARQAGKVINIASVMSQLARPGIALYGHKRRDRQFNQGYGSRLGPVWAEL